MLSLSSDHGIELEGDTGLVITLGGSGPEIGGMRRNTPRMLDGMKKSGSEVGTTGFLSTTTGFLGFFSETVTGRSMSLAGAVTAKPGTIELAASLMTPAILGATVTAVCTI